MNIMNKLFQPPRQIVPVYLSVFKQQQQQQQQQQQPVVWLHASKPLVSFFVFSRCHHTRCSGTPPTRRTDRDRRHPEMQMEDVEVDRRIDVVGGVVGGVVGMSSG